MKITTNNFKLQTRRRMDAFPRSAVLSLLSLSTLLMFATGAQAARPGGVAVLLPPFVYAPAPVPILPTVSPFDMIGFIQSATVTNKADYFSGGTMEVNGVLITIPRNTIFQMPATQMTWADMFINAPAAYQAANQSGLALSDSPKPLTTYEVHVQGNRVVNTPGGGGTSDQYIAGLVFISQQSGTVGNGIVNAIDYSRCVAGTPCMPDVWVGNALGAKTGARMRINSMSGRYGAPDPAADPRFTADEDNPTIVARTG